MDRRRFRRICSSATGVKMFQFLALILVVVGAEFFTPGDVPGPPEKLLISPASDSSMLIQFSPPLHVKPEGVNGSPVLGYKVEVARRVDEVQTFSVAANGPILAGAYRLNFGVEVTSCIPWNASEVEFEMALEELPRVDSVGVYRSAYNTAKNGFVYTVTFDGAYLVNGKQTDTLVGDTTNCQGIQPPNRVLSFEGLHVTTGVPGFYPEVWEIVSTGTGAQLLGGTFDLSVGFEGDWVDTTNPVIKASIAAGSRTATTTTSMLGVVNRGDRVRIGGEEFTVHATAPFTDSELPLDSYHVRGVSVSGVVIKIMDTALGNVQVTKTSQTVATSSAFTAKFGAGEQIRIGTRDVEVASVDSVANTITLVNAWPDESTLHVTAYARKKTTLSVNAEAADMKRALGALPGVGTIDVSRIGPTKSNGHRWYVTFQSLDSGSCPTSPCLRLDKKTGTTSYIDVYGVACTTCTVTASIVKDESDVKTLSAIEGDYAVTAIVASQEVGGVVAEVQSISTRATADDISGSFEVSFQNVGGAVINFDDTAADVRSKLQNLATVGRLNVTRVDNSEFGVTWIISFLSNVGDLPLLVFDNSLLKGTGVNVAVQEVVKGADVAFETIIDGLVPGQEYFVRGYARNENGYGTSTTELQQRGRGALPLIASVATSPEAPGITGMWPLSGSQMELRLSSPVDHGDPVSKYLFEYAVGDTFGNPATKKLYVYTSLENDIVGTFRLQYGDDVSSKLSVHSTASTLESALNNLPCLRPVSVTRVAFVLVLTGEAASCVSKFDTGININRLTTTPLTAFQSKLLVKGARIYVGSDIFTVKLQPTEGSSSVDVEQGHGVSSFTMNRAVLKVDNTRSERGSYGYEWTITFDNVAEDIIASKYPGLQMISSLTSVKTGSAGITYGIHADQVAASAEHYGYFEINNDERVCDTYVVGAPSPVQVVRLFGATTATGGTFKLKLGSETTECITLGQKGAASTMKAELIALDFVSKVTVEEVRAFKVTLLDGSMTSKVTDYDNTGKLTVASALTQNQVDVLPQDTIIQVSRNPNDFSRHSCEFTVTIKPSLGATEISVSPTGSCDIFTGEARSLKLLDFHDYNVRFWGHYPTGEWPTLQFDSASFGAGTCTPWAPSLANLPVYGQVHTLKYEGLCSKGQAGIQTILADASSTIGGTFTLSYMGEVTSPLSFEDTGAAEMRDAIDSITAPGTVNVSVSQYGNYGKAWHVTFVQNQEDELDSIFIQHSRLTGHNALISVYPTVTVFTDAKQNDISGSFRISFGGETTESIGFSATHMKVTQELQKLNVVDLVLALGDKTAGDIGVYSLELKADAVGGTRVLSNIQLGGMKIDPTQFMAIGETLVVGSNAANTIQSMTPVYITLTDALAGTGPSQNFDVLAGLITKQTKPLPGFLGISRLAQVVAGLKDSKKFELPTGHGIKQGDEFFVGTTKFKVLIASETQITTDVDYTGANVVAGSPKVYLFDNKLQTTEDLTQLVKVGDHLWVPSASAGMDKYSITAKDSRYLTVSGSFTDSITRTRAYHTSNGRKWNLVFRSYDGNLDTIDAIPEHDWRGTDARIGTRSPKAITPNLINVGNPAPIQTILLEVTDTAQAATYTLAFAGETTLAINWDAKNSDIEEELKKLKSVDGVSVKSLVTGGTVIHTVSYWGAYTMKKLPLLVVTPITVGNLKAYVHGNGAVAVTKQDNFILESSQAYAFRIFAENSKGASDSVSVFQAQTSASSVVPTPPTGVALGEFHGPTWLSINYWAPFYSGGADVTMYRIEWDSSSNFDSSSIDYGVASIEETPEVQQITISYRSAVGAGGTFTLSWGARTTSALAFDCSIAAMTDALAIITETSDIAVDPVKVTRTAGSWGYAWKITFLHDSGNLAPLVADGTQLTGDFPRINVVELEDGSHDLAIGDFTHEVQEVYTTSGSVLGDSFTLTFSGKTTGAISVSASALEMQAALQAITTIYSIKVTKTVQSALMNIWAVTFAYLRGEEMVGAGNIFTMATSQVTGTSGTVRVANKISGSDPFRFSLTGLRPGVKYYTHVMAYNADGFGSANSPYASAVTCGQPGPPQTVTGTVVDGTTLAVSWDASAVNGALCSIDKYKIEWYREEGIQEQQTITSSAGRGLPEIQRLVSIQPRGGYFKLSFGGEVTENIRWDAKAIGLNSVKERLERLSTVGTVDVSKTDSIPVVGGVLVEGLLVTSTVNTVTRHSSSTSTIASIQLKQHDIILIAGNQRKITAVAVTGGVLTITIDQNLVATDPVPVFLSASYAEWKITFQAGHVGPQEVIQVFPSDSWIGSSAGIYVDPVQKGLQPISGTFTIAFASGGVSDSTPPLPHNVSASDLQIALERLVTIGAVDVTQSANGYGYNWVVVFLSEFANGISLLSVDGTALQGPGARIQAARTREGKQPSLYCERKEVVGVAAEIGVPGQLRYVIPELKTGQKYAIRVRAHNSEGYGYAASITSTFQIPRTTPSAPQIVTLIFLSSRLLKVSWSAPASNGGSAITSYRIQWDISADFTSPASGDLRIAATDVAPFYFNIPVTTVKNYFTRVFAVNSQGGGAVGLSSPSSITPSDRTPGCPEEATATVLSSYAILVEWKPSSTEKNFFGGDGGLRVTQYMIEWDSSPDFDSPAAFGLVDGAKRSYIIGGDDAFTGVRSDELIPGSSYSIRVTAFNAKGAGAPQPTTPSSVIVTDQPPSAPQNLNLSVMTATSVKADWTNPLYDGGASLKSYQVEWDEQDDFSSGQSSSATIPIVREMQSVVLQSDVVNEEQFVEATVKVTNEQQVVRTTFTGVDEIQVIKTTNNAVVDEIQTVTTSATDRNEVQELRLDADDVDEVQAIRTTVPKALEVQTITVGVARVSEIHTITITLPGAAATPAPTIGGDLGLSFDSSICTHCVKKMYQHTSQSIASSLTPANDGAQIMEDALNAFANIDTVKVTRTQTTAGNDRTTIFSITFSGNEVAGNVPVIGIDSAVTLTPSGGGTAVTVSGIPTAATELIPGSEVAYSATAKFSVTYTCESYTDPYAITSFSTPCTPSVRFCSGCVTDFDGTTFTISKNLAAETYVQTGAKLIAGVCSFEVGTVTPSTSTTITVAANDVGAFCSKFAGKAFSLYKTPQLSRDIPLKMTATTISSGSVVEGLLTSAIDSVTISRSEKVDNTFVGSVYTATFRKRSGTVPLLSCTATGSVSCIVDRSAGGVGSMITGTFKVGLVSEADALLPTPTPVYTENIPWDASEADMKSILEAVKQSTKNVFGTVSVKRTVYAPSGDKWSGGFTWQITFTSRGWNIPKMVADPALLKSSHDPTNDKPTVEIEDATNPLEPFANSRDGNQVSGKMTLKFREVVSNIACEVGVHTSLQSLDSPKRDTLLETFFKDYLTIPTTEIMRSAATQARGFTWTISFSDASTVGDIGLLQIKSSQLAGLNYQLGVYETVKGNQLGGSFQLSFNGETTEPIDFAAEGSEMETKLNKLGTIKPSSVKVSRGAPTSDQVLGYTWYVTFFSSKWEDPTSSDHTNGIAGNWKGAPATWDDVWESGYSKAWGRHVGPTFLLKCITDGLMTTANDGSQSCLPIVATPGVGPIKGTFRVEFDSSDTALYPHMAVNALVFSDPIPHNAWATKEQSGNTGTSVEEILERMSNVGDVAVTRGPETKTSGGYEWTVTFLRDASDALNACEQLEELAGSQLCNAPGNAPQMVPDAALLSGSNSQATVTTTKDGTILRGDFTDFKVQGDAGVAQRYSVSVICSNAVGTACTVTSFAVKSGGDFLQKQLLVQDRITVGTFDSCTFEVTDISISAITVTSATCAGLDLGNTGATTWMGLSIRLPWNADESLVQRVLEAAATNSGRKVNVQRTVHGKYGEMSWLVRFISNPTFTPPGAGNLPDITTTFLPESVSNYDVTVTQLTPGSTGLSGSFLLDFHSSSYGPREIFFDEDPDRLQRKINEMDTIGRVTVKRFKYPSTSTGCEDASCSGGWDDKPVQNSGSRGGYRWRIRFMKATGDYEGFVFPPGSGNVASLSVTRTSALLGTSVSVDVSTNTPGSSPLTGAFSLNTTKSETPTLPYFATAESMKLGIEAMDLFGEVDVTRGFLLTQKIPGATATLAQDGSTATITGIDDIRQFIAPTDIIRFGSTSPNNLPGSNSDAPFTGVVDTSRVVATANAPIMTASNAASTKILYPGMQLRIDGLNYQVQRTGHEIQTITVTRPTWTSAYVADVFKLEMTRNGVTKPATACFQFNDEAANVQAALFGLLFAYDNNAKTEDVVVSRVGPVTTANGKGYVYSVYFHGDSVAGDVAPLKSYGCASVGSTEVDIGVVSHGGKLPHQRLILATDSGQVEGSPGYFKLSLDAVDYTDCINWGASATELKTILEKTFETDLIVTRTGSGTSQTELQRLRMTANTEVTGTGDLFKVQFTLDGQTAATKCLNYGVSADDLQVELNKLNNLGNLNAVGVDHINVTRDGDGQADWGYGYEYLIHFRGPITGGFSSLIGDVPQLEIGNVGRGACSAGAMAGIYPALTLETVRQGSAGFTYDIFFMDYKTTPYVETLSLKHGDNSVDPGYSAIKQTGGSVHKISVEMVELGGSSEMQILKILDKTVTGAYKLKLGSQSSSCLAFNAADGAVATALIGLMSGSVGDILLSHDTDIIEAPNGFVYTITFVGESVTGNIPLLTAIQSSDAACTTPIATTNVVVESLVDGGSVSGEFAVTKPYDGEAPDMPHVAYTMSQQFSVMDEQFEIQQLIISNPSSNIAADARYKLTVLGVNTVFIPWDASETTLQDALMIPLKVTAGDIVVTRRTNSDLAPHGFIYTIYFSGPSVSGNMDDIQVVAAIAPDIGPTNVLVSTVRDGVTNAVTLTPSSIPLALPDDPKTASPYLSSTTEQKLDIYKVNGVLWTIKFKSSLGNIPVLGKQTKALYGGAMTIFDNFIQGSAANSFVIPSLLSGINYHVHVAALTDIGIGPFTPSISIEPSGTAMTVQNVAAGYALYKREVQEIRLAASHITEIQEITTEAASIPEVQTLRTYASPELCPAGACITGAFAFRVPTVQTVTISAKAAITTGTFTLLFERKELNSAGVFTTVGGVTDPINWDADAQTVKTKLTTVVGSVLASTDIIVTRDGDASADFGYGYVFQITFIGNNVAGETSRMTCTPTFTTTGNVASGCTVTINSNMAMGTDTPVQEVIVSAKKPLVVGSYQLYFAFTPPVTSDCIPFDASADVMKSTLEKMSNIDRVYVTRETYATDTLNGFAYRIFFLGNGAYKNVNQLQWKQVGSVCSKFQTQENNVLTENGVDASVARSILTGNAFIGAATATADQLTTALNQLPVFGKVLVTQSLVDDQGGFIWTVAFEESEANLPQFICAVDSNFKVGTTCETNTLTDGNVLSGSFFIGGSASILFNADEAKIKSEIEAMTTVNTVQVKRSPPSSQFGYTWTITFVDYNGDVPPLLVTSSLVGTGSRISVREVRKGNTLGGTFTLSYLNSVTAPIPWDALETAATSTSDGSSLQEKLEALDVVGRVSVQRSGPDQEGGYSWLVTFLDNVLNSGDLPLLQGNASTLTGEGAVVFTREITKGSNAVGDQLWLSFDPPVTDSGSPITKYQVRWDTSSKFTANPAEFSITDADILYRTQRITTSAPSLVWSSNMIKTTVSAVQKLTILSAGTFTLTFRGVDTTTLTAGPTGASTIAELEAALEAISSIGSVDVSFAATTLVVNAEFKITFTALPGALPLLSPDSNTIASVAEVSAGTTNFRKEVVVFKCVATQGTVKFSYNGKGLNTIKFDAKLVDVEAELSNFIGVEADSISVTSVPTQKLCSTANPADITMVFHRVYGDINLDISQGTTNSDAVITPNNLASIDGVYNDNPALTMSGTFQVGYQGLYTRPLNAESSADQLRYALEDLESIQTVSVVRDRSYQALPGKVDVTEGEIFVTCSAGETCNFYSAAYGLPRYFIRIGGDWYTVLTDVSSPGLHKSRLYLGDVNGREIGYKGLTQTSVVVYEWTKGYMWTVGMLSVTSPLGYLRAKIPRLYPLDSTVRIYGQACTKCYYLPTQTTKKLIMGQQYNIEVYAYNFNGKGAASGKDPVIASPSQVPSAPSNVNLAVVSGIEIEVFFSPPPLGATNASPNFNNDISSYLVQWDTNPAFKHGGQICSNCAVKLDGISLTVSAPLANLMALNTKFTIGDDSCMLEVKEVKSTQLVEVKTAACANFNGRSDPLYYYTYPPSTVSGSSIQGLPPFRYVISSLTTATTYYVRVAAVNSVPTQAISLSGEPPNNRQWSYPLAALTADRGPDPPLSVFLNPFSASALELQIQLSTRDGKGTTGTAITDLWIEVDTVSTFDSASKRSPTEISKSLAPELYAGGPRIYYLTGLTTGTRYFVQVKAVNSVGNSRATLAPTPQTPTRHPNGPLNVKVSTLTSSSTAINSATVTWQKPAENGGLPVTGYKVEWWRRISRPEIQTIELKWIMKPSAAPFKLAFDGVTMAAELPMDVTAENLRFALMSLIAGANIPVGHIKVTRSAVNIDQGYQWSVTFDNTNKNAGDQPLIQFIPGTISAGSGVFGRVFEVQSGIAVPAGNSFPGKQEVQVLVIYATSAVGGYFRLSYKGSAWTNFLSATVDAADLKLALEALPTIGVVTVHFETTQLGGSAWFGKVWTVTFESNVGNLAPIIVDSSRITPTGAVVGIKDGDNVVDPTGVLSLWDPTTACPAAYITALKSVKQQAAPTKSITQLAVPGEAAVEYGYYETLDASTLSFTVPNLTPGLEYLVSVSAKNAQGLSVRTQSSPMSIIPPLQVPGPPVTVSLDVNPGVSTQLLATWAAPASDGGSPVWMYRVEYDVSSLFTDREKQEEWCPVAFTPAIWEIKSKQLTGTNSISNGYFKLKLTGKNDVEESDPIPWNAVALAKDEASSVTASGSGVFCTTASPTCTSSNLFPFDQLEKSGSMQSKLGQFTQLTEGVEVTRSTQAIDGGYTWTVTFLDGGQDLILSVDEINLACTVTLASCAATYNVVVLNTRPGVVPSSCVGNHVVPEVGALSKGQLYYVRVFAYNQVGFGEPKLAAAPQKPMVAPGAPTGVTLAVWTVSELVVLFNPPDDDGGDTVTGFEVQWAADAAFTSPSSVVVQLTTGMSAPYRRIISALTKGTRYYVRIRAKNSQGLGQFQVSSPTSQQPYTTPSSPTQAVLGVTSATMLTVGWAPPYDDGGDIVSGYVVQWDISSSFDSLAVAASTTAVINDATQRSYTITLLTPGTRYFVRVFARNLGGKGTPQTSAPTSMVPATTRPGKPNSLAVAATATIGQLQVVWQPPRVPAHGIPCAGTLQAPQSCPVLSGLDMVYGGVSLESYLVQYADASDFALAKEVAVTATSATILGLESGKTYYVRVLTVNSQGLNSDFCVRANDQSLLCPDHLVLEDGSVATGAFVSATPK